MKFYFYINPNKIDILQRMNTDDAFLEECETLVVSHEKNEFRTNMMFSLSYEEYIRLLDSGKINVD